MNPRHKYAALDGVRGWAALMVAYAHFIIGTHPALLGAGPEHAHFAASVALGQTGLIVLYKPQLALDIFFVLSGFVLATSVNSRPAPFVELVVRRSLRLGLPVLATTALIWPLVNYRLFPTVPAGALTKSEWLAVLYNTAVAPYPDMTLWRLLRSLYFVFITGVDPSNPGYNPVLWTMKMEFWGSIGLFAGYCLLPAAWARRGAGLAVALVAIGFAWRVELLGAFCCGIALFEIRRVGGTRLPLPLAVACAAGVALLVIGVLAGGLPYDGRAEPYRSIYVIAAAWLDVATVLYLSLLLSAVCLVASVLTWAPLQRPLLGRVSQWLGRVSFALYLVHLPILCSLGTWLLLRLEPALGYNLATLVTGPVFLATSLTAAHLVARWVDEPAIRVSRQIGASMPATLRRLRSRATRAGLKLAPAGSPHPE